MSVVDKTDLLERIEGCINNAEHDDEQETLIDARDYIVAQAAEIERLQRSADSWEADALRYTHNAEYWKAEVEKYKSALGGTIIWATP